MATFLRPGPFLEDGFSFGSLGNQVIQHYRVNFSGSELPGDEELVFIVEGLIRNRGRILLGFHRSQLPQLIDLSYEV